MIIYGPESLHRAVYQLIYCIELYNTFPRESLMTKVIPILKKEPAECYKN